MVAITKKFIINGDNGMNRRQFGTALATSLALLTAGVSGQALAQEEIRIGYAISKTGPYTGGASTTVIPNYEMWEAELKEAGGITINGRKVPVRFIAYDDRSNSEEVVRAVERLINQDKVDFILPPWGTAMNLAVAPILDRHGYPHLATTMISDRIPQLRERWANQFYFVLTSSQYAVGIVEVLEKLRADGKIKGDVAIVNVADQFGVELSNAARARLKESKFNVVYDQSYPLGQQDMQSMLNEIRRRNPEVFLAFSYPPDTLAINDQAKTLGFNPKLFYTSVGTVFPIFKQRMGDNAEGVMGFGGVSAELPVTAAYRERHLKMFDKEADFNGSAVTYATLQMLQQAIERTNSIDRAKVSAEIRDGSFETVLGPIKLQNRMWVEASSVGQWQDGKFQPVHPADAIGVKPLNFPKPEWKN